MNSGRKYYISVFIIWLFTISGIIGISIGYRDWFLGLTPLNLLIYLAVILWNEQFENRLLLALLIPFGIGMFAELLGVNYGLIFGNYAYGENLGYKIAGVPLMIGINWAVLTYCSAVIGCKIHSNVLISSLIGATFMTALDVIIEVSAPRFDFWEFEGGVVPLQNYVGWWVTAFLAQILFQKMVKYGKYTIAMHIFISIFVFFTTFLFI